MNSNFHKVIPLLKSLFDTLLILSVTFFFDKNISGEFIARYFWVYSFAYFTIGVLTIKHSGNKVKIDDHDGELIFIIVATLMASTIISLFLHMNNFAFLIIAVSSLLSVLDNTVFVRLEKIKSTNGMFISTIYGRFIALILIILISNEFNQSIVAISWCFLIKELVNLVIFNQSYYSIIKSLRIKSFSNLFITINEHKSNFIYLLLASLFDPLSRFFIITNFDKSAVVFYEYANRIPRIASMSLMQLSRYQLFTKTENEFISKSLWTDKYISAFWLLLNLICIFLILDNKLNISIGTSILIAVTTLNLAMTVKIYN